MVILFKYGDNKGRAWAICGAVILRVINKLPIYHHIILFDSRYSYVKVNVGKITVLYIFGDNINNINEML
jgi:hypothetical protein